MSLDEATDIGGLSLKRHLVEIKQFIDMSEADIPLDEFLAILPDNCLDDIDVVSIARER